MAVLRSWLGERGLLGCVLGSWAPLAGPQGTQALGEGRLAWPVPVASGLCLGLALSTSCHLVLSCPSLSGQRAGSRVPPASKWPHLQYFVFAVPRGMLGMLSWVVAGRSLRCAQTLSGWRLRFSLGKFSCSCQSWGRRGLRCKAARTTRGAKHQLEGGSVNPRGDFPRESVCPKHPSSSRKQLSARASFGDASRQLFNPASWG